MYDPKHSKNNIQLVHVTDGSEIPRTRDNGWIHTVVVNPNKKRFYCYVHELVHALRAISHKTHTYVFAQGFAPLYSRETCAAKITKALL